MRVCVRLSLEENISITRGWKFSQCDNCHNTLISVHYVFLIMNSMRDRQGSFSVGVIFKH